MNPSNPLFAIIVFLIAYLTAFAIQLRYKPDFSASRFESIDGMRGFLAIGVFIHHAVVWFGYVNNGKWESPKSNLYNQLGDTNVSLFFMITSFLFISKLLNTEKGRFNWLGFFRSRIYRLMPMYYFSIAILIVIVFSLCGWQLNVPLIEFFKSLFHWAAFTVVDNPKINGFEITGIINSWVVWSLPLEWLFYFTLPLIGIFLLKIKPGKYYLIGSVLFIIIFIINDGMKFYPVLSFMAGGVAPFLRKYTSLEKIANTPISRILILLSFCLLAQCHSSNNIIGKSILAVIFTLIALGDNVFGILRNDTLKFLGEISYSTYLLHGIILFVTIYMSIGIENVYLWRPYEYGILIFLITPVVVISSFLGFRFIEKPFMDIGRDAAKKRNATATSHDRG